MTNPKFSTLILVCGLAVLLAVPNVEAKVSLKKAPAQTTETTPSSGFFGTFTPPKEVRGKRKTAKEAAVNTSPKVIQSAAVPEKKNEKTGWNPFSGLFVKKNKENTANEVPLPSENAVPRSNLNVQAEPSENPVAVSAPESQIITDSSTEAAVSQTEEFTADSPQIFLESSAAVPETNPLTESTTIPSPVPDPAESMPDPNPIVEKAEIEPKIELDAEENILNEITAEAETENSVPSPEVVNEEVSSETQDEMPTVPLPVTPEQVVSSSGDSEPEVNVSELRVSETGELVSGDSDSGIPDLEFMETTQKNPVLNVSPQRLVSPAENGLGQLRTESQSGNSVNTLESIPSVKEVEIGQRFGHNVTLGDSPQKRAELKILTRTPENMLVGVQTEIMVEILNVSTVTSEGSIVEVSIPDWLQVVKMTPGKGEVNFTASENSVGQHCVWNVGTILPNVHETMVLTVIPEKRNAANIQVSWSNTQFAEHQTIVSEEPEIQLRMLGPKNIQEGRETQLNILVRNTGTCVVHEVALLCEAVGCQNQKYFIPGIQTLLPGEEKSVELNITPASRNGANLHVKAFIKNRCFCETDYDLNVNYVDFQIQVPEQEKCFVGMDSHIPIIISNAGNTSLEDCRLCVEIPPQLQFAGETLKQIEKDPITGLTTLNLGEMPVGESRNLVLDLHCMEEGQTELPVGILLKSRTVAEKKIPLILEGVASVEMKLNLPKRVLVCSETGEYEIQLINSGTQKIEDGKLTVYFSEGFEPVSTNLDGEIQNGGVVVFNIPVLVPGESQTFRLQAESGIPGNHAIRCELKSEAHQLNLIQQETVIFR